MSAVFIVEVRKNGTEEWERLGTFSSRDRADKLARVARRAIDVDEARVVEK